MTGCCLSEWPNIRCACTGCTNNFREQYVLYVGSDPMRMQSALVGPQHVCFYKIVDIRSLNAETLVDSPFHADAVVAILARYAERPETIRRILDRVVRIKGGESTAFSKVLLLAGIRGLEKAVRNEAKHMPILNDIMDHKVIGPAIREGMEKGLREGSQLGRREEALLLLRRQIAARFGSLSGTNEERLGSLSLPELEDLGVRLMKASRISDLFEHD